MSEATQFSVAGDRRSFLKVSAAAALLPAWFVEECRSQDKPSPSSSPNERPHLALIGCGGRGRGIAQEASRLGNVIAVCDVDNKHAEEASKQFKGAKVYKDFRKLLERKDVDAILNGTPDHWHTLVNLAALKVGKDVYSEKPLTLTIDEGKRLVAAVKEAKSVLQVGSQQRSDPRFRLACELVRNGRLGELTQVTTILPAGPNAGPFQKKPVPDGLDWDFWQGQAPERDYMPERTHLWFRYWLDYSGGTMTDWGAHHNDIAQWGLGMDGSGPVAVEAEGKEPSKDPNAYNIHPTFKITYTYANGAKLICSNTTLPDAVDAKERGHDNGVLFLGEDGKWIFVNRGMITASDKKLIDEPLPADALRLQDTHNDHMGNFLDAVRKGDPKLCICPAEVGHRSVTVCHLGNIALRSGKKLKWDPAKEQFDEADANKWLRREMRAPWKLEA